MMIFIKNGDIYKIARITGSQDNILGVSFSEQETTVELVEWSVKKGAKIKSSPDQVLTQVLSGLNLINNELGGSYHLSKVYYLPSESSLNSVYELLIQELIKEIHSGNRFLDV